MEPLNCLIVEDETPSVELLKDYIERLPDVLRFIANCDNAREAKRILQAEKIDLIFLDMELSGSMTGIDFLDFLDRQTLPPVIITSGKLEYIAESFEFQPRGIMQKGTRSFSFNNFETLIRHIFKEKNLELNQNRVITTPQVPTLDFITLRIDGATQRINFNDIKYICADNGMSAFHLSEGKVLRSWDSLKKISADTLPPQYFCRIHDKYIIGRHYFKKAEWRDRSVQLTDGTQLPIGDTYLRDVKQFIEL
ncbi:MAG: response regulator [Saprospiraceae bacterium]|nr:response regulator [Saprospiraceae bacterium]